MATEYSSFFKSIGGDKKYTADQFADYFRGFMSSGVYLTGATELEVTSAGDNMTVDIAAGKAFLEGYFYKLTGTDKYLTVDAAHSTYTRYDRVILKLNVADGTRSITAQIKKGTAAASPLPPTLVTDFAGTGTYEISLAMIEVGPGVTTIASNKVADERTSVGLKAEIDVLLSMDAADVVVDETNLTTIAGADLQTLIEDIDSKIGSGGTVESASNVGATGEGMFKQLTGSDLEFKKLKALTGGYLKVTSDSSNVIIEYDATNAPGTTPGSGRAIFFSGSSSTWVQYFDIATTGNAADFGEHYIGRYNAAACGSGARSIFGGGYLNVSEIYYVTTATLGNTTNFGSLSQGRYELGAHSSATRGIFSGGYVSSSVQNTMDYVTIATTGNASDFGDLTVARAATAMSGGQTRGVTTGGYTGSYSNVMDYATIATTGNATDFGDLTVARSCWGSLSSYTRLVALGGEKSGSAFDNTMDYITIASAGNATDFGDLQTGGIKCNSGTSNNTRGVSMAGNKPSATNEITYITIASTGNYTDFGDLRAAVTQGCATSDSHGGI